jgi:hypothetical protein
MKRQILLSLFAFVAAAAQTPTTVITFREGANFTPRGINNHGQIVGDYTPTTGGPARGFLRSPDGSLQVIEAPNTTGDTRLNGINDLGEIVGAAGPSETSRAFLRDATGQFTDIHYPPAIGSAANAINNTGFLVGAYLPFGGARRAFFRNLAGEFLTLADIVGGYLDAVAIANTSNRILLLQTNPAFPISASTQISTDSGSFSPLNFQLNTATSGSGHRGAGINAGHLVTGSIANSGFLVRIAQPNTTGVTTATDGAHFSLPNASKTTPTGINDKNQIIGTATIQGQTTGFLLDLCSPVLPQSTRTHGSGSEFARIDFQTEGFCLWAADTDVPWISFTRSVGNGPGTIAYTLQANTSNTERIGRITVGSSQIVITQASSDCQYTVTPNAAMTIQPQGASLNFSITTTPACPWTASSPVPWVRILEPATGTGSTTITAVVDAYPSDGIINRSAALNIAGVNIALTQTFPPCSLQIARTSITAPAAGSIEGIHINTRAGCTWSTLDSLNSWISYVGPSPNPGGAGTLTIRIAPNPGPTERAGIFRVSQTGVPAPFGQSVVISVRQLAAANCSSSISPSSVTITSSSIGLGSFEIVSDLNCPTTVTSEAPWVRIVSREINRVVYTAEPNPTRFPRRGIIRVNDLAFVVDQLGNPDTQLAFVPLNRCRILDTRTGSGFIGDQGSPALNANFERALTLTGRCNIPTSARAVALHVTAIPVAALSYLTIYPDGATRPLASTLNSWDGRIVANLAVVPATKVAFYATDNTHLLADVLGYFTAPAPEGIVLYPVTPCRLLDTRASGNSPIPAGATRTIPVTSQCGIPAHATALSLNVTAIPRNTTLESLTVYPAGQNRPAPTPLNAAPGRIVANATILAKGANGSLSIHASHEADVVIDVNAYFAAPSDSGLYFTPLSPCRIADTRSNTGTTQGALAASTVRTFTPTTSVPLCGIPAEAKAHLINATLVPTEPTAFLSLFPAPLWTGSSTLNAYDAQVTANAAIVPDTGQGIGALSSNPTHLVLDSSGFFMAVPPEQRRPVPLATSKQDQNQ